MHQIGMNYKVVIHQIHESVLVNPSTNGWSTCFIYNPNYYTKEIPLRESKFIQRCYHLTYMKPIPMDSSLPDMNPSSFRTATMSLQSCNTMIKNLELEERALRIKIKWTCRRV